MNFNRPLNIEPAPETHGRPMPRATTAAWLVMPPRAVTMPRAPKLRPNIKFPE